MKDKAEKRRRLGILTSGGFAHFIHDGFTDGLFVLLPIWANTFGLSHSQVGFLKFCMTGTLAGFQMPAGFLAERFGERVVLSAGTILAGSGFILLVFADGFSSLALILIIAGIGTSVQHPLASSIISTAHDRSGRRAALGMYNFAGDLGKIVVPFTIAAVITTFGWQTGTTLYGIIGILAGGIIFIVLLKLRSGGRLVVGKRRVERRKELGFGIHDRLGFFTLSAISMIDNSARTAFMTFLPFLLVSKGLEMAAIGFSLALILSGGAAGKLICGFVAERLGILRTVVLTESATGVLIFGIIVADLSVAMFILPVLGVALNGTSSVLYGTVGDFVEEERQARAFGIFYTLSVGAAALAPLIYGSISDAIGLTVALLILASTVCLTLPLCLMLRMSVPTD